MKDKKLNFIKKANKVHQNKYDYSMVEYINVHTKIEILCPIHGSFFQTPSAHIHQRQGCPSCSNRKKGTTSIFIKKAIQIHGNLYDYSKVEYVNNDTKIEILCPIHGSFFQTPRNHIVQKSKCSKCNGHDRLSYLDFTKKAIKVHGNLYDYSKVEYVNMRTPVIIGCNIHGWWKCTPTCHIHSKTGCPVCNKSKGEQTIERFLKEHQIQYVSQYAPPGLRGKNSNKSHLRFDFFLPKRNILIEFDGEQHYKFKKKYHKTIDGFIDLQLRDERKNQYALSNDIKLIRILHNEIVNIPDILTLELYPHQ